MTITIAFSSSADGYIQSNNASYATAVAGSGLVATTNSTNSPWGQNNIGGDYDVFEIFMEFPTFVESDETLVTANFHLVAQSTNGTSISRDMELRSFDWGGTLTTADWRTPTQLNALTLLGTVTNAEDATSGQVMRAGSSALMNAMVADDEVNVVVCSSRTRTSTTPSAGADEGSFIWLTDTADTVDDPRVVYLTLPQSTFMRVGGQGTVQLSDGTHVYLEADAVLPTDPPTITLKHRNAAGTVTTIATVEDDPTLGFFGTSQASLQAFALVRDTSDNLYVLGHTPGSGNSLAAKAYQKGIGHSWTARTRLSQAMPTYGTIINNVVGAWHSVGGTAGTIMALVGHPAGTGASGLTSYALLNCDSLLAGTGSLLRGSGNADTTLFTVPSTTDFVKYQNPTGTGLDVVAAPGSTDRGYAATFNRSGDGGSSFSRYTLNATGSGFSGVAKHSEASPDRHDANSKYRVVAISDSLLAEAVPVWLFDVWQNIGAASTFTNLGFEDVDEIDASTLPSSSAFAATSAWDIIYDPNANLLWLYYFDVGDAHRLMRTSFDLDTMLAREDEIEVNASVGASGSTNWAIRAPRGLITGDSVLLAVANESNAGAHSTLYVVDSLNAPPTTPTLTTKVNYDATDPATFAWTFNDPNAGDTQSAYQLQINTSAGVFEYDTGKVSASAATFVAAGVAATGNNATLNPALPAGIQEGDTLLLWASIRNSGTGTVNVPTGWQSLVNFGNTRLLGKIYETGDSAPSVTFANGAANADTIAQVAAFRNLPLNVSASATQLNGSAQNIAYPALTVPENNSVILFLGWKQDDWTSVDQIASASEIGEPDSTAGDDAGMVWDYRIQTTKANISAASFAVTGGASAISRGITVALGPAGNTATNESHVLPANTLTNGADWQWRVRTWDSENEVSPWSDFGTFSTSATGTVDIIDPASDNPADLDTADVTVEWEVTGADQDDYRVQVFRTDTEAEHSDTGFVTSEDTTFLVEDLMSGVEYRIEVTVRDGGVPTNTAERLVTPDYSNPEQPTITVTAFDDDGYVLVSVNNPTPDGDNPEPTTNLILRRVDGSSDAYETIGSCDPDGSFRDYTAASGVTYEYVARATV